MDLGEKLRTARLEAGLSQRQLCGEEITRNMLSQIENGTAKPSMKTLQYLAGRLGKPVSFFLDEDAEANSALLDSLNALRNGEEALAQGKHIYAAGLLEQVTAPDPDLQRRRLLLEARLPGADPENICARLPSLDEELLLRARAALSTGQLARALHLLEAMEDRTSPQWNLLRGQLLLHQKEYAQAAQCFHAAEEACPGETAEYLEQCYRELEDFKMAYFYACKRR